MFVIQDTIRAVEPCRIQVVDEENNWPVPLVELRTTHDVRFVSDNAGLVAFDLPELMNVPTWLFVEGHGYGVDKDGFGYRGVRIVPRPGETITIRVKRQLPAIRLGRITGAGIFAESQKLGEATDWQEQRILGCDSVQNAVHQGRLFWGWGDTIVAHYPLGRFHMIGATTDVQPLKSLKPPVRLRYSYVTDKTEVPRNVAQLPGDGPTWLSGYASLPDQNGVHRLVATYSKIKPPLSEYERGLCVWNESVSKFEPHKVVWQEGPGFPKKPPVTPTGHAVRHTDDEGVEWIYFGDPFPFVRLRATFEAWSDAKQWQLCQPQTEVPVKGQTNRIRPHRGAIAWSNFRRKWVTVFTQQFGESSALGEIWYAEADSPTGPWKEAVHIVTHRKYTFYNPQLHPEFTAHDSPVLLFEATFTRMFSSTEAAVPRNNYNQVLYRLDLDKL